MAPAVVSTQPINAPEFDKPKPHSGEVKVQDLRIPKVVSECVNGDLGPRRDIIIFSDFDGTIFMQDTGHILFDAHGCGAKRRGELDEEIKSGIRSFREVSEEMWGSLNVPFDDGFDVMKGALDIDPAFLEFHNFCIKNNIPFNVISAGLKPILRRVLNDFLGEKQSKFIDIIANDATISEDGKVWKPVWRHNTPLGHDKAATIQEYRTIASSESEDGSCPLIIFIGDGVSDLAAAREADVLFARAGLRLEEYCRDNKIPYIPFNTFADILKEIIRIIREDQKVTGGYGKPVKYNPRANFWRKSIKKKAVPRFVKNASNKDKMHLWPDTFSVKEATKKEATGASSSTGTASAE